MAPPPCGPEDAKVTLTREALSRVLEGKSKRDDELKSGGIKVTGKSPKAFDDFGWGSSHLRRLVQRRDASRSQVARAVKVAASGHQVLMETQGRVALVAIVLLFASFAVVASAQEPATGSKPGGAPSQENVAEIGAKLSNPVSDVWALFTQFGLTFSDGDVNTGDPEVGGNISFQPILPIPLHGSGDDAWRLIVRPTIPLLFDPVPQGFDRFDTEVGLGDTLLPLPIAAPAGNWILALGPTFTLPTSTKDAFGRQQWAVGPTGVLGYKTEKWIAGVFPQYFFGIGSRGDQGSTPDASYMSMLYFAFYNLPDAWQIGFNPTISYDAKASSGNRWNVPVGLVVTKTTRIASRPVKFQFGFEYSVVSQDDFGQRFQIKLNVIPVISALIDRPLFGGN